MSGNLGPQLPAADYTDGPAPGVLPQQQTVGQVQQAGDQANPFLAGLRRYLAPVPGTTYSNMLPLAKNPDGSVRPAIPNMARDFGNSAIDMLEGVKTGMVPESSIANVLSTAAAPDALETKVDPNVLKTFGGPNAANADLNGLLNARIYSTHAGPQAVFSRTGWFRNPVDNMWRYEIDDSKMQPTQKLVDEFAKGNQNIVGKLGDYIQHDDLFNAYPHLRNATIQITPEGAKYPRGLRGGYGTPQTLQSGVRTPDHFYLAGDQSPADMRSTLVHELQHAIQHHEGFEGGGNTDLAKQAKQKMGEMAGAEELPEDLRSPYYNLAGKSAYEAYQRLAGEQESREVEDRLKEPYNKSFLPGYVKSDSMYNALPINRINQAHAQFKARQAAEDTLAAAQQQPK